MAGGNNLNDFSFYLTSPTGEVRPLPLSNRSSTVGRVYYQADDILPDRRDVVSRQGRVPGPSTNVRPTRNIESGGEFTLSASRLDGHEQSSKGSYSWPAPDQLHSTSMFDQNVRNSYPPSSGPTRSGQTRALNQLFEPYGLLCARATDLWPLTRGVVPETAADAESNQQITEKDEAPKTTTPMGSNDVGGYHITRKLYQENMLEICSLIKRRKNLPKTPTWKDALTHLVEYIPTVREAVYPHPRLETHKKELPPDIRRGVMDNRNRRDFHRTQLEELSRYYRRENQVWQRQPLVKEILEDLKVRYACN